mmetsp:Transcript_18800/g.42904  ORF Transcript_18800/g.42904 Transcript_18800/m.42904 type:complete len:83 (+) Transcript_18800:362-610(+)
MAAPMNYVAAEPEEKTETSEIRNAPSKLIFGTEEPEYCLNSAVEFMEMAEDPDLPMQDRTRNIIETTFRNQERAWPGNKPTK